MSSINLIFNYRVLNYYYNIYNKTMDNLTLLVQLMEDTINNTEPSNDPDEDVKDDRYKQSKISYHILLLMFTLLMIFGFVNVYLA